MSASTERGENAAAFLVGEDGTVQWSSRAFEEVFPTAGTDTGSDTDTEGTDTGADTDEGTDTATDAEGTSFYARLASLVSSASDDQELLSLAGSDATREGTLLELPAEDGNRYYRQYSYPVAGTGNRFEVFQEVTARRKREERLSKFASVVSHDLRNPMDVAMGRAEMLPEIADVDEATERHLDDIYESLKRMERLIQDVLTLTRQSGDTAETEAVSLASVANQAWRNVDSGTAMLTVEVGGDYEILAHRSRLLRVFENLFRNAVQHGSEDVTVEVGLLGPDQSDEGFYVADDGPGIPERERDRVFEDGFTTAETGTGLGLPIVREIARAHDWRVELADGNGTRVEFTGVSFADP